MMMMLHILSPPNQKVNLKNLLRRVFSTLARFSTQQNKTHKEIKKLSKNMDQLGSNTNMDIEKESTTFDYSKRAQWLRAAVLGANDGLVSTASLMMGVGAVKHDVKVMILSGFAGMVAGACSMAIGEFVSVYSQYDIEVAQMERDSGEIEKEKLPSSLQAAAASALAFSAGAIVPLLAAAFLKEYKMRIIAVVAEYKNAL